MQTKLKLYFGWLVAAICSLIIGIVLFLIPEEKQAEVIFQPTIEPEVTNEVVKYGVQDSKLPIVYVDLGDKSMISATSSGSDLEDGH